MTEQVSRRRRSRTKLELEIGLGNAIRRLIFLDTLVRIGNANKEHEAERELILTALNRIPIELPVACFPDEMPEDLDGDGAISFFEAAASSSCCRIRNKDTSRANEAPKTSKKSQRSRV